MKQVIGKGGKASQRWKNENYKAKNDLEKSINLANTCNQTGNATDVNND
jgi:hypothetical protein